MATRMLGIEELMQLWQEQFPEAVDWGEVPEADRPAEIIRGLHRTYARPPIPGKKGDKPYFTGQEFYRPEEAHFGRGLHRLSPEGAKQAMSSLGGIIQQHTAGIAGLETAGLRENILMDAMQKMGRLGDPKAASAALDQIGGQADEGVATVAQAAPRRTPTLPQYYRGKEARETGYRGSPWMQKVLEYLMDPRDLDKEDDPLRYATP